MATIYKTLYCTCSIGGPTRGLYWPACSRGVIVSVYRRNRLTACPACCTLRIKEDDMRLLSRALFLWRKQWADIARGFKYALSPTPTRYSPPPKTDNPIATDWSDADIARLQSTINNYKYDNK